jgi:hypothetical protein
MNSWQRGDPVISALPPGTYRLRLLIRCLGRHKQLRTQAAGPPPQLAGGKHAAAATAGSAAQAGPGLAAGTDSASDGRGATDLLAFLDQEAQPYRVVVPPYKQKRGARPAPTASGAPGSPSAPQALQQPGAPDARPSRAAGRAGGQRLPRVPAVLLEPDGLRRREEEALAARRAAVLSQWDDEARGRKGPRAVPGSTAAATSQRGGGVGSNAAPPGGPGSAGGGAVGARRFPAALLRWTVAGRIAAMQAVLAARSSTPAPAITIELPQEAQAQAGVPASPKGLRRRETASGPPVSDGSATSRTQPPTPRPAAETVLPVPAEPSGPGEAPSHAAPPRAPPPAPHADLSSGALAAQQLMARLACYRPMGREDGPRAFAALASYAPTAFAAAAREAAAAPGRLLAPLSLSGLTGVASAFAAAGHRDEPLLAALCAAARAKLDAAAAERAARGGAAGRRTQAAAVAAEGGPVGLLSLRTVAALLVALARLGTRGGGLAAVAAAWLARELRAGVKPRARARGTWLAAALWAAATLEALPPDPPAPTALAPAASDRSRGGGGAAPVREGPAFSTAAALLFTEAAEALREAPGWFYLFDGREALWALWAFRAAAAAYADEALGALPPQEPAAGVTLGGRATRGTAAGAGARNLGYEPDELVEIKLAMRAASQVRRGAAACWTATAHAAPRTAYAGRGGLPRHGGA